jgi:guanylate kinase
MDDGRLGVLMVICAPSGTGKTTLVKRLLGEFPRFAYSVSYTTRAPRQGEENGKDYHFVNVEEFQEKLEQGFFAEWAEVHGNFYGTPLAAVREQLRAGRDLLFDIDVQGARQLKKNLGQGRYVFVFPPSRQALEDRLRARGTDDEETIARRLQNAADEMREAWQFDTWLVNDDLDTAYDLLRAAYLSETMTPAHHPRFADELLAQWEA